MTDCFDNLPEWAKKRLSVAPGHKEWKRCERCHTFSTAAKLKICSGCAKGRGEPVYYCGKECQKEDWPHHKAQCKFHSTPEQIFRNTQEPDFPQDEEAEKKLERWEFNHNSTIGWCILQIYHHNLDLNPADTFIIFCLHPETMQIMQIGVESREKHAYYFESESFKKKYGPDTTSFALMSVLPSDSSVGYTKSVPRKLITLRSVAMRQETICRVPQWPWIAAQLSTNWKLTADITVRKLHLLQFAIAQHVTNGNLVFEPTYLAPSFKLSELLEISPIHMDRWNAKLCSFDLWGPPVDSRYLVNYFNTTLIEFAQKDTDRLDKVALEMAT